MKLFLDVLPQFGLAKKVVLPLATGGTLAHVLALDYGLRPVLQSMGARWVVPSFFVTSDAFVGANEQPSLSPKFEEGLEQCISAFIEALCMGSDGGSARSGEPSELIAPNPLNRSRAAALVR
jgi:FMN reductase